MTSAIPSNEKAYVYGLRAVDSAVYFYVGSTKFDPAYRLKQHLTPSVLGRNQNKHFVRTVRRIGPDRVTFDVLDCVPLAEQFDAEYAWMRRLIEEGVRLTNIVLDRDAYVARRQQEEFLYRVTRPEFLLAGVELAFADSRQARDPRYQPILDRLREVARLCFRHLLENHREDFLAHLEGRIDILTV